LLQLHGHISVRTRFSVHLGWVTRRRMAPEADDRAHGFNPSASIPLRPRASPPSPTPLPSSLLLAWVLPIDVSIAIVPRSYGMCRGPESATCAQSIIHSRGTSVEKLSPQSTSSVCVLKVGFANQNAPASSTSRTKFGKPIGSPGEYAFAA